ncbi:ribonuclease H-like domain-containing protein [Tanacetum coccineum]|uniref:Ribonuclease H-like domain-containing protein n=1 Tax=Tanacetum coccineum TaxID=301880 RepID=A0ABQ5HJL4_9ASTR
MASGNDLHENKEFYKKTRLPTKQGILQESVETKEDNRRRDWMNSWNKDGNRTGKKRRDQKHNLWNMSEPVVNESYIEVQPKVWSDAPIIEEYESDGDNEYVSVQTKGPSPSFANKQVKTPGENVKEVSTVGGKWDTAVKSSAGCKWRTQGYFNNILSKYNGGSRDNIEFCGLKGIKREYSNVRTPQQNGIAERKNMTLIEAVFSTKQGFIDIQIRNKELKKTCHNLHIEKGEKKYKPKCGAVERTSWHFDLGYRLFYELSILLIRRIKLPFLACQQESNHNTGTIQFLDTQPLQEDDSEIPPLKDIHEDTTDVMSKAKRNIPKDFNHLGYYACFLSQQKPQNNSEALEEESWYTKWRLQKPLVKDEEASDVDVHLYRFYVRVLEENNDYTRIRSLKRKNNSKPQASRHLTSSPPYQPFSPQSNYTSGTPPTSPITTAPLSLINSNEKCLLTPKTTPRLLSSPPPAPTQPSKLTSPVTINLDPIELLFSTPPSFPSLLDVLGDLPPSTTNPSPPRPSFATIERLANKPPPIPPMNSSFPLPTPELEPTPPPLYLLHRLNSHLLRHWALTTLFLYSPMRCFMDIAKELKSWSTTSKEK